MPTRVALLSLVWLFVGCATQERTYDISVRNDSSRPITLALEKDGPPGSEIWMTPEQLSKGGSNPDKIWGLGSVPSGKQATAESLKGVFPANGRAWLRVYAGDLNIGEMLKIHRGDVNRLDLALEPGRNAFIIRETNNRLQAQPTAASH